MIIVLSTYPNKEKAEAAAKQIIEKKLAACVNAIKIESSTYEWKGEIRKDDEYLLIIKSTEKAYKRLDAFIKEKHSYEVPEIIYYEVKGGNKDYIQWVESNTV